MKDDSGFLARAAFGKTVTRKAKFHRNQAKAWPRKIVQISLASSLALLGTLAFESAASAHTDLVAGVVSCASPLGTGYDIHWSVTNDYNLSATAHVTAATGGLSTVTPVSFAISASGNGSGGNGVLPYKTSSVGQTLPHTAAGAVTLTVASTWSDGFTDSSSGTVTLPITCNSSVVSVVTPPATVPPPPVPVVTPSAIVPPVVSVAPSLAAAVPVASKSALSIVKTERVGERKAFVRGPIHAFVGQKIRYQLLVTNTGNTSLVVTVTDRRCDVRTLSPVGAQTIAAGRSLTYDCAHVVLSVPRGHVFKNVGSVSGLSPQGTSVGPIQSSVTAKVFARPLKVKSLPHAKVAIPINKTATFTG